jgi:hypothetical protein
VKLRGALQEWLQRRRRVIVDDGAAVCRDPANPDPPIALPSAAKGPELDIVDALSCAPAWSSSGVLACVGDSANTRPKNVRCMRAC